MCSLRTQSVFPGGTVDPCLAGPPAPATHQAVSFDSAEGNRPQRWVKCLGLEVFRGAEQMLCVPRLACHTPVDTEVLGVKAAHPSWSPNLPPVPCPVLPLYVAWPAWCDRLLLSHWQHCCCPVEPGCWQDGAGHHQGHQPLTMLPTVALHWQLWRHYGHTVRYLSCWVS